MTNKPRETFNYGISLDWSDDNRIAIIATEGNMARAAVDTWAELTMRVARDWTPGQKLSALFDMTGPKQGYTPYAAKRTIDVYRATPPQVTGDVAIVMRNTVVVRLLILLIQREGRALEKRLNQRFFTDLNVAHDWLRSRLPELEPVKVENPSLADDNAQE